MRSLLDINVLLALMNEEHLQHRHALGWWASHATDGWASCPLTQNGFVRISTQASYAGRRTPGEAFDQLIRQLSFSNHEFWPDDISVADAEWFDHSRILGPRQITDVYLLGLAVRNGGRLVTFDRGLPVRAVRRAEARHLIVL